MRVHEVMIKRELIERFNTAALALADATRMMIELPDPKTIAIWEIAKTVYLAVTGEAFALFDVAGPER